MDRFPAMEWVCQARYFGYDLSKTEIIDENSTDRIFLCYWNSYSVFEKFKSWTASVLSRCFPQPHKANIGLVS